MHIKRKKTLITALLALSLANCGLITPFTSAVSQGKHIINKKVFKVIPGMSKSEVKYLLGSPDMIDTFNPNKYIYIKTYKAHMQEVKFEESDLVLTFNNDDKLISMAGNYNPPTKEPVF